MRVSSVLAQTPGGVTENHRSLDTDQVKRSAEGRAREILPKLGIHEQYLTRKPGPCPACGTGTDRYHFDDRNRRGDYFCRVCGAGDLFDLLMKVHRWTFPEAVEQVAGVLGIEGGRKADFHDLAQAPLPTSKPEPEVCRKMADLPKSDKSEGAQRTLSQCHPPGGTLVETYLGARGIALPEDSPIRFHPSLWHWPSGMKIPAMVCPIVPIDGLVDDPPQALHQTFLTPDGFGKADVERNRLYFGPKTGGVVKLTPDDAITYGLALAEGVESALSAIMGGLPTWACLDAGNLAAFPVLPGIECLTIVTDHDKAGIDAAETVARRWAEAGRETRILLPRDIGADLNDCASEVLHG